MKKKIKDLTPKELREICLKHRGIMCDKCPLDYRRGFCLKDFMGILQATEKKVEINAKNTKSIKRN